MPAVEGNMLYGWMKSIIIYLILSGILVNLSPGSNYKKYIHFFTGLLLLVIMVEPITQLFNIGFVDLDKIMSDMSSGIYSYKGDEKEGISDYYELSVGDSISRYLKEEGFIVLKVEVITNEEYEILKCTINYDRTAGDNAGFDSEDMEYLKNKISDVYNVETDNIYIVNR